MVYEVINPITVFAGQVVKVNIIICVFHFPALFLINNVLCAPKNKKIEHLKI